MIIVIDNIKFIFLFITTLVYTQELPPIENYAPKDYGAGNQNWSISQSDDKYIYVANNSGLLEFNGANWKLYPSPNGTILRPGAKRISTGTTANNLNATSFINKDGSIIIIALNDSDKALDYMLTINNKTAQINMPANAIQTIVLK